MTNNKGITLIALVITIIVLLILAGVSIAMLTGNNGILTQANNAKNATTAAEAEEAVKLAVAEILANKMDPNYSGTENVINQTNLQTLITKNNGNVTASVSAETGTTVKYFDVTVTVNKQDIHVFVESATGKVSDTAPEQTQSQT